MSQNFGAWRLVRDFSSLGRLMRDCLAALQSRLWECLAGSAAYERLSCRLCNRTLCYHNFSGNSESPFATQFTTHNTCRMDLWERVPGSAIALFASTTSLEKVKVPSLLNLLLNLLLTIRIEWECLPYKCKTFLWNCLAGSQSLCWPSQFRWKFSKVPARFVFLKNESLAIWHSTLSGEVTWHYVQ